MAKRQFEAHKCAVRNCLRYAYIALKDKECSVEAGSITPYEEFYKRLNQIQLEARSQSTEHHSTTQLPTEHMTQYSVPEEDVKSFYTGHVTMEQFVDNIENCFCMYDPSVGVVTLNDNPELEQLILNRGIAVLFSLVWELYGSNDKVASVCSNVQSSCGQQLWEIFLILDTNGQLALEIDNIVDLFQRLSSISNGSSKDTDGIRSLFGDQDCIDFISFIQNMTANNCLHMLQKQPVQEVYNFVSTGLIHHGQLMKRGHVIRYWKLQWVYLTCSALQFYESPERVLLNETMTISHNLELKELPGSSTYPHVFRVCDNLTKFGYELSASTEKEMKDWMYQINLAIKMYGLIGAGSILNRYRLAKASVENSFRESGTDSAGQPSYSPHSGTNSANSAWVQEKIIVTTTYNSLKLFTNLLTGKKMVLRECQVSHKPSGEFTVQWMLQYGIVTSLNHPNVLSFFDIPEELNYKPKSRLPSVCMEYCDGGDLRRVLWQRENRFGLDEPRIRQICADINSAIQYLHSKLILHRDVNPGNILLKHVGPWPGKVVYKLSGFHSITNDGKSRSPAEFSPYAAPEVFMNKPSDASVDIWSLGAVIFKCATGKKPFFEGQDLFLLDSLSDVLGKKEHGVIHIYLENSEPVYSHSLPPTHKLSKAFEIKLTSWLQKALEFDPQLRGGASCLKMLDEILSSKDVDETNNAIPEDASEKHLEAVKQAMKRKGKLDHTILQGVYLGPARSGKSSLIKRLTGEGPTASTPSTGVAEEPVHIQVRQSYSIPLSVTDSIWFKLTYNTEALHLMLRISHFISKSEGTTVATIPHPDINTSQSTAAELPALDTDAHASTIPNVEVEQSVPPQSEDIATAPAVSLPDGFKSPTEILRAVANEKEFGEYLETSWSLYLTDTGGQMEFQDLLPLLVSGPSIFFITFRLNQDLNKVFTIQYELPDGNKSEPYESTLTLLEAILQSLASISSMGTFVYKGLQKHTVPIRPKVFLVGTHKDMLDPATASEQISQIDQNLQEVIKATSHYRDGLIEFASPNQLIFTVNNLSQDEADFKEIRVAVEKLVQRGEFKMSSPSHWLIFSLVIRSLKDRIISFDECFSVAQQCGISDKEELKEALHFLHTKLGVVRYFPDEELGDIVVKDPQVLFDKVTELIVRTFTFENVGKFPTDEFNKKGIFSLRDFERIAGDSCNLLTPTHLLKLLQCLRIVAPFQMADGEIRYFIPCVLAHAEISTPISSESHHLQVPSLVLTFKCGYCPKGLSGALITYLITNEMKSELSWNLHADEIFRDQVSLVVGPDFDTIVVKILPTNIKITCLPNPHIQLKDRSCSLDEICNDVRESVENGIAKVTADMNYLSDAKHSVTFDCQCQQFHDDPHASQMSWHKGKPSKLQCPQTQMCFTLPPRSRVWFGQSTSPPLPHPRPNSTSKTMTPAIKVPLHPSKPDDHVSTDQDTSSHQAQLKEMFKLLLPVSSEWDNIGTLLDISDGELKAIGRDYGGVKSCLKQMLHTWLNQVDCDPAETWNVLAEAVEPFNPNLSAKILHAQTSAVLD